MNKSLTNGFIAAVLATQVGCATQMQPPVNRTVHVPANTNENVAISRCEDNGFLVLPANAYNMRQVDPNQGRRYGRYYGNGGLFGGGVSSSVIDTARGSYIVQYPKSIGVDSEVVSRIAGGVAGYALGGNSNIGRIIGTTIGYTVLGPMIEGVSDQFTVASKREKATRVAECISDIYAINGGPAHTYSNTVAPRRSGVNPYSYGY